jgi:GNAT superfamily N-acetyltransferase
VSAPEVRLIADDEVAAAAGTLARAFAHDPLGTHERDGEPWNEVREADMLRPGIVLARAMGEVWCTPDLAAVACWRRPGAGRPTDEQRRAAGIDGLPPDLLRRRAERSEPAYEYVEARRDALHVRPEHWYCTMVGVEGSRRREGLGSAVLAPVLARAAASGVPVFLDTFNPANPPFYTRNGFRCLEADVEPVTGLPYWLFLR